jgi:hypothetical protein
MRSRFLAAHIQSPEVPMKKWWVFPFLAVLLVSCSADVPTEIVGYWEGEVIAQDLKFTADGRVEIVDHKYSTYGGTYRISEDNVLTCDIDHNIFDEPLVYTVRIKGDKLILKEGNREDVYHRRK